MKLSNPFKVVGPGIVVAATGLGAGDIVAASVAGARFGTAVLWAVVVGAILKFVLTEGLARWQLVTGKTLLEGWFDHLPRIIVRYFFVYLLLWSCMVSAALMSATGLAAHAVFADLSVTSWGMIHAVMAMILVWLGQYRLLESLMKFFTGLMCLCLLICALLVLPGWKSLLSGIMVPTIPDNSLFYILGIIGGVGGSVTVMSYGYWMREAGWKSVNALGNMRLDLYTAYTITGIFGLAIIIISAGIEVEEMSGNAMALAVADRLGEVLGNTGKWIFLTGFWGAVFSSMIGVWHGVPYLFANFRIHARGQNLSQAREIHSSWPYRGFLLYMGLFPMLLLFLERPVWIVVVYAATGALFMPLLAGLLFYMNCRQEWLGKYTYNWIYRGLLIICMLLFGLLLIQEFFAMVWPAD